MGLATGGWLQKLKGEYLAGHRDHLASLPEGSAATVAQFSEQVMRHSGGQKLVYATGLHAGYFSFPKSPAAKYFC